MKRNREKNFVNLKSIIAGFFLLIAVFFYLRQQYFIIRLEKEINLMYDQLRIEENRHKQLVIELQKLTNIDRLKHLAKELNFVPVKDEDIIIVE